MLYIVKAFENLENNESITTYHNNKLYNFNVLPGESHSGSSYSPLWKKKWDVKNVVYVYKVNVKKRKFTVNSFTIHIQ